MSFDAADLAERSVAAMRMARWVEDLVREEATMAPLRDAGAVLEVTGGLSAVTARALSAAIPATVLAEASINASSWWEPEERSHAGRLAKRLAAELRMKWDRRQSGDGGE